ncbi:hypothetical protein PENTCL1PPCAC_21902 [Pristionchus entomophagus]|uniref:Uncharacterized protein n=1 Tax=Pristionchus entomophagus TaxID=358040 RepID=A0AAV5TZV0_9BILA|nr:hypothetical protein PENTCL1PPCAC_21902 [Pristionchus entomophagus]
MAEAPPTTRVRMEMWKALCCRPTKVNDQSAAKPPEENGGEAEKPLPVQLTVTRQPGAKDDEVVLFVSPQLLARGLLGKIVKSVEKKQLQVHQMEMKVIPKADLDKFFSSRRLKHTQDEKAPSMVLSVKGEDAMRRVAESCADIGKQHALTRLDLVWSTTSKEAKKDLQLLFPPKPQFVIPPSPIVPQPEQPQPAAEVDSEDAAVGAMDDPAQEVSLEEPKESPKEAAPA